MIGRTLLIATLLALAASGDALAEPVQCGTKTIYGKTLPLFAEGVSCERVEEITRGECEVAARPWFCFSPHAPGPALFWAKDAERFADEPSAWIEARRLPCSQSRVTRADWKRARGRRGDRFPAEQQLLADDLIRCKQLKGMRSTAVRALLGAPDTRQRRYMDWSLGSERGSMFQIDSEYLTVIFNRKGFVRSVTIEQG